MREPEDAAAVGRDLDRHAFAHAAEAVEQVTGDKLEVPSDRFAVAGRRPRRRRALRRGFRFCRFFRRRLRRLLCFCSFLRGLLLSNFHSTLHALTSRAPLARFDAAGEEVSSPRKRGPHIPEAVVMGPRVRGDLDQHLFYELAFAHKSGRSAFFQSGMAEIFFSRSSTSAPFCRPEATLDGKPGLTSTLPSAWAKVSRDMA